MTQELFRMDSYVATCTARIAAIGEEGLELDRTVFYPTGGGQPGDRGTLTLDDGHVLNVADTRKTDDGRILHLLSGPVTNVAVGQRVTGAIDWERRYRLMRVHTCLHLLCAVIPEAVTGGSIREDGTGRLDFNIPEPTLDKEALTARLNELVASNSPVNPRWITDDELAAQPELVRTMSVQPPTGTGKVRLLEIDGIDLQPCGGTHVASTGEIGPVRISKIEKKGKQNRRVNIALES